MKKPFSLSVKPDDTDDFLTQMVKEAERQGLTQAEVNEALGESFTLRLVLDSGSRFEIRRRDGEPWALFAERVRQLSNEIQRAQKEANA